MRTSCFFCIGEKMIIYQSNFTNTNGVAFPSTAAVDVSVPGAGDGTEFKALMVNDLWGYRQAIMNYAGLTPNNASEVYNNSQILEALKNSLSPVGTLVAFFGQTDPASLGYRFLECQGQTVNRTLTAYQELDTVCYVGDGNNSNIFISAFFRTSDAGGTTRSTTGNYLVLPDLRGKFLRGYDPTALRDPQGALRPFPNYQEWATQAHSHRISFGNDTNTDCQNKVTIQEGTGTSYNLVQQSTTLWAQTTNYNANAGYAVPSATNIFNTDNDETRPSNENVKWLLRY